MRLNTTDFSRKMQHPLLMALTALPIALLLALRYAPAQLWQMATIPGTYVLLSWGCILIPGRKRLIGGVISALALAGMGVFFLPWRTGLALLLIPVMYSALLFVALPIGGWPRNRELAVIWHVGGVITHVAGQVLVNVVATYGAGRLPLLVSFLLDAALVLLALNRASLDSAAQSRRMVPLLMRRQNLVVTLGMLLIGVGLAAIPAIGEWLSRAWDWLMQGVAFVAGLLMALLPRSSGPIGGAPAAGSSDMGFGEAAAPSELAVLMEKIIGVVAAVVLVIALVLAGRVLWKKLIRLVKYLWGRLGQYGAAAGEDYEDEITSTRDEPDTERGRALRLGMRQGKSAADATPNGQVRARYRQLKRRHRWQAAQTARETLPDTSAALYERVRYGGESLTQAEAEQFRESTKRL